MLNEPRGRVRFFRRAGDRPRQRLRRGVYLLPSLMTMGNMFCGYACVVYAARGEFETAAPFIGFAIVLDMLDGRIARLTGTTSEFGVQFDSLADIISFGIAPAILSFSWGLAPLGRLGWAAGFLFVAAAAMRLARFNIQAASGGDKRYFVGMPSPAAAGITAATVYAYPWGLYDYRAALPALAMVLAAGAADGQHHPLSQLQDDRLACPPVVHDPDRHRRGDCADHDASHDSCSWRWRMRTWHRRLSGWPSPVCSTAATRMPLRAAPPTASNVLFRTSKITEASNVRPEAGRYGRKCAAAVTSR